MNDKNSDEDHGLLQRLDERTLHIAKLLEDLPKRFSSKWVERVMIALILALATGSVAAIVGNLMK